MFKVWFSFFNSGKSDDSVSNWSNWIHRETIGSETSCWYKDSLFFLNTYEFYWYSSHDTNVHSADNHAIRVLTRSKSKAEQIFPGKKVMTTLLLFY